MKNYFVPCLLAGIMSTASFAGTRNAIKGEVGLICTSASNYYANDELLGSGPGKVEVSVRDNSVVFQLPFDVSLPVMSAAGKADSMDFKVCVRIEQK